MLEALCGSVDDACWVRKRSEDRERTERTIGKLRGWWAVGRCGSCIVNVVVDLEDLWMGWICTVVVFHGNGRRSVDGWEWMGRGQRRGWQVAAILRWVSLAVQIESRRRS